MTALPPRPPLSSPARPSGDVADDLGDEVYDPLRLCIFATIALLGWALGPFALLFFATLGVVGYVKARRAGLRRSKCFLRDTRLVLGYLGLLAVAAALGIWLQPF